MNLTTKEQEILEEISDVEYIDQGLTISTRHFSLEKLASYLARMESTKSEKQFFKPDLSLVAEQIREMDSTPKSEEKVEVEYKTKQGCIVANGFLYCRCGNCQPVNYQLPQDYPTPPSEEKKCVKCETYHTCELGRWTPANAQGKCGLAHYFAEGKTICACGETERPDSPTPPDAWEEFCDLWDKCFPTEGDARCRVQRDEILDWLHSKKEIWEREGYKRGREEATKGWGHQKREWRRQGRKEARTTTLDELATYIQDQLEEAHSQGTYKYDWLYEDLLTRIKEMRPNK